MSKNKKNRESSVKPQGIYEIIDNFNDDKSSKKTPWEEDIGDIDINEDGFICYINFFIESTSEYSCLMELFNEIAKDGSRWKIKVISMDYIRKTVLDHCTKTRDNKPFNLLCDQIIRYTGYGFEGRIPPSLLAYFIKYEIRKLKIAYEEHIDHETEYEEAKMDRIRAVSYKPIANRSDDESVVIKSRPKAFSKVIQPKEVGSAKHLLKSKMSRINISYGKRRPESELTIRAEDNRRKKIINDYPTKGPHVYLIVTTIYEQLPAELIEIMRIPVTCIMKVGNDEDQLIRGDQSDNGDHSNKYNIILQEINNRYTNESNNKEENIWKRVTNNKTEIERFWSVFNKKIQKPENTHYYENTILAKYCPSLRSINFMESNWKDLLKQTLYNEISHIVYSLYYINELYMNYSSLQGQCITVPERTNEPIDMEEYNKELEEIPNEYITVPFIFHSMVKQVVSILKYPKKGDAVIIENTKSERENILESTLEKYNLIHDISFKKVKHSNVNDLIPRNLLNNKYVSLISSFYTNNSLEECRTKSTKLLKHLFTEPFRHIKSPQQTRKIYFKHMYIFQKSLGIRSNKKLAEILIALATIDNFLIPDFTLEKGLNKKNVLEASPKKIKYLIEMELGGKSFHTQTHSKLMKYLNTIEEMSPDILLPTLFELKLSHNTCEYMYIPLLDSFLYKFYNCSKEISQEAVIQTPTTLRDFFNYSLPNNIQGAKEMIKKYINKEKPKLYETKLEQIKNEISDPIGVPIEITPRLFVDTNSFILETEKDEISDMRAILKFLSDINYNDTFVSTSEFHKTTDQNKNKNRIRGDKEREHVPNVRASMYKKGNITTKKSLDYIRDTNQIYDLGKGTRIQFNYRSVEALFRHGTKVRIQYKHRLYGRKTMNLELEVCQHRLYYCSNVHINTEQSKFILIHRTGLIFLIDENRKSLLEENEENTVLSVSTEDELEDCKIDSSPKKCATLSTCYSLTISWPSGYILETKFLNDKKLYIKHSYPQGSLYEKLIKNETSRLYLQNNSVIRLLNNNTVEMLYPSGKKILCHDYEWEEKNSGGSNKLLKMNSYKVYNSCGKICSVKDGQEIYEGNLLVQETQDLSNNYKCFEIENGTKITLDNNEGTQTVQFQDGTTFITKVITTVGKEFIQKYTNDYKEKSYNIYEEYVYVLMSTTVEHPYFSTTHYCPQSGTTTILLPKSITIQIYANQTYDIMLAKGSVLSVKEDRIVFDKYLNKMLIQHSVIIPNVLKYNFIPEEPLTHFFTSDTYGNEFNINSQSEIHYKYALSEQNAFCLKKYISEPRYMLVRHNMSGIELFPYNRLNNIKTIVNTIKKSQIQEYWNVPFKDTIILFPPVNKYEEDIRFYSNDTLSEELNFPSTYGEIGLYFPFYIRHKEIAKSPKIFISRILKTLICDDPSKIFEEAMEKYKKTIDNNSKMQICKCYKTRPWDSFSKSNAGTLDRNIVKQGKREIKYPSNIFLKYLEDYVIFNVLRRVEFENSKDSRMNKFYKRRSKVINKEIPPYFSSSFGIAYFITKELEDKVNQTIDPKSVTNC